MANRASTTADRKIANSASASAAVKAADSQTGTAAADTKAADSSTGKSYSYGGDNVKDYTKSIENQYNQMIKGQGVSVDSAVSSGTNRLNKISEIGQSAAQENLRNAGNDLQDSYAARDAIEQNNGNRQGIGYTQYGQNEISYDQQRANIAAQQAQLEKDITRQVADLRSQGEYEKADAVLQTAQEKFQQLYTDALRRDTNLRSNYEYITGLQRDDKKIQRDQETADKEFAQKMGELLMSKGLMPEDSMLTAMGIDKSTAQLYVNAVKKAMYSSGGYGGSGRGRSRKSGRGSGTPTYTGGTTQGGGDTSGWGSKSAYNQRIANQVWLLASKGSLQGAKNWLNSKTDYFSAKNAQSVWKIAEKKYAQWQKKHKKHKK